MTSLLNKALVTDGLEVRAGVQRVNPHRCSLRAAQMILHGSPGSDAPVKVNTEC